MLRPSSWSKTVALGVADMTLLRAKARASGVYFRVVKNTLVRRAVADTPFAALADKMVGPLAYGMGTDPLPLAKVLNDFAKGNDKFVITGGAMPGQMMTAKEIACARWHCLRAMSCIAKLMGTMQAPIAKFVRTLNEVPSRFVRTLAAVRDAEATGELEARRSAIHHLELTFQEHIMAVAQAEILDKISSMTVLELSELIKAMEDKFGVSAARGCRAARCRRRRRRARRRRADRVHRHAVRRRRKQGQRDQGRSRAARAWA